MIPPCKISIHAPARGATVYLGCFNPTKYISIHAPARGATDGTEIFPRAGRFQFTPLREGRLFALLRSSAACLISIHAPARGATCRCDISGLGRPYFNSRPCERGDPFSFFDHVACNIFQFTPLREGRRQKHEENQRESEFQFTPLREGRQEKVHIYVRIVHISIHAPARGATAIRAEPVSKQNYFNSRPCERGDSTFCTMPSTEVVFQFTPLREGRHQKYSQSDSSSHFNSRPCERGDRALLPGTGRRNNFNSRPCERGDSRLQRSEYIGGISIHAPARGATKSFRAILSNSTYFNSRPCERGDMCQWRRSLKLGISIHAPARGATQTVNIFDIFENFNSRPCERGDVGVAPMVLINVLISIHAPARGATEIITADSKEEIISIHAPARGATYPL